MRECAFCGCDFRPILLGAGQEVCSSACGRGLDLLNAAALAQDLIPADELEAKLEEMRSNGQL